MAIKIWMIDLGDGVSSGVVYDPVTMATLFGGVSSIFAPTAVGAAGAATAATAAGTAGAVGSGAALGGLGSAALTAGLGGAAAAGTSALLASKAGGMEVPTLSGVATAPYEKSPGIMAETNRQLGEIGGKGRSSTILAKKKRKTDDSILSDGDSIASVPAYTNTSLG